MPRPITNQRPPINNESSITNQLKIELCAYLGEPRRHDRRRVQVRRTVDRLVHVGRVGVECVEEIQCHQRPRVAEPQQFAEAEIKRGVSKETFIKNTEIPGNTEWKGDGIERPLTAAYEELTTA